MARRKLKRDTEIATFANLGMDTLNNPPAQLPRLEIFIFVLSVVFVFAVFKSVVLADEEERPVNYRVPVPEQCSPEWNGEVLEEPTIKVPSPFDMLVSELDKSHRSRGRAP